MHEVRSGRSDTPPGFRLLARRPVSLDPANAETVDAGAVLASSSIDLDVHSEDCVKKLLVNQREAWREFQEQIKKGAPDDEGSVSDFETAPEQAAYLCGYAEGKSKARQEASIALSATPRRARRYRA